MPSQANILPLCGYTLPVFKPLAFPRWWQFLLCVIFVISSTNLLVAQELWTGGGIQVRASQWLSLELEQQIRFDMAYPRYKSAFVEPGLGIRLNKHFKVKMTYRNTDRGRNDKNRVATDLYYSLEPKKSNFDWKFRVRWQRSAEELENSTEQLLRAKVAMRYNLSKKAYPYFGGETFYRMDDKDEIRRFRLTFGVFNRITPRIDLETFFRVEREVNVKNPERTYIVGMSFSYGLDLRKEDK